MPCTEANMQPLRWLMLCSCLRCNDWGAEMSPGQEVPTALVRVLQGPSDADKRPSADLTGRCPLPVVLGVALNFYTQETPRSNRSQLPPRIRPSGRITALGAVKPMRNMIQAASPCLIMASGHTARSPVERAQVLNASSVTRTSGLMQNSSICRR